MSRTIRRNVLTLCLAGLLATAARPVTARDLSSPRQAAAPRTAAAGDRLPAALGFLDQAWAWLHQVWAADSIPAPAPPAPPACGDPAGCVSTDEGPIIDPNGGHH